MADLQTEVVVKEKGSHLLPEIAYVIIFATQIVRFAHIAAPQTLLVSACITGIGNQADLGAALN